MIHDDYGLPVEVIIMLLMYVKSIHKDNTSYIEAVAKNWAEEEINTHEKSRCEIKSVIINCKSPGAALNKCWVLNHRSPSAKKKSNILTVGCMNGTLQQI